MAKVIKNAIKDMERQIKQTAKAEALRKPWMKKPYDVADLKAQRKDFLACAKGIDKVLAIIAPPKVKPEAK